MPMWTEGSPVPETLRPSDPADLVIYEKALMDLKKFFPDELFKELHIELVIKITGSNKLLWLTLRAYIAVLAFLGIHRHDPYKFALEFAEKDCAEARKCYIQAWLTSLSDHKFMTLMDQEIRELKGINSDNLNTQENKLDDNLWSPIEPQMHWLHRYMVHENSISRVMTQFATNIKAAVDTSPDGLVILPKNSKGIELRIKKDTAGYYLA